MYNRKVSATDAHGKVYEGILLGYSSVDSNKALIKISSNKILEICKKRVKQ